MNDTTPPLPDRLSIDPRSKFHVAAVFEHDVGIKFNGKERWMWMNTASAKAGSRSRPAKALDRLRQSDADQAERHGRGFLPLSAGQAVSAAWLSKKRIKRKATISLSVLSADGGFRPCVTRRGARVRAATRWRGQ
jgi:hypothetical protein